MPRACVSTLLATSAVAFAHKHTMPGHLTVSLRSLPKGCSFVPKGNAYITANCRKLAQENRKTIYLVLDAKKTQIGIAVPTHIHDEVRRREVETRPDRARNVERRDASIEKAFEKAIRQVFPHIPTSSLAQVLSTALKKGKGRVGRTGTKAMLEKAELAVRAHIRHCHTPYDQLMRHPDSLPKHKARAAVEGQVSLIARSWCGQVSERPPKSHKGKKSASKKAATRALATLPSATLPTRNRKQLAGLRHPSLPMLVAQEKQGAAPVPPEAAGLFIGLAQDEAQRPLWLSQRDPPSETPGTGAAQASTVSPISTETRITAGRIAKAPKGKRTERAARKASGRPNRVTRSMQHIEQPIHELAKRLPESPEPERSPTPVFRVWSSRQS